MAGFPKVLTRALRLSQLVFASIALALFVILAKGQVIGMVPVSTGYCATAAAFALLASLIGIIAIFISKVPVFAFVIIDAIAVGATFGGAVAYSVYLKGANCSEVGTIALNNLLNCGIGRDRDGQPFVSCPNEKEDGSVMKNRCGVAKAGDAFLYMTCIISILAVVLSIIAWRRAKTGRY